MTCCPATLAYQCAADLLVSRYPQDRLLFVGYSYPDERYQAKLVIFQRPYLFVVPAVKYRL